MPLPPKAVRGPGQSSLCRHPKLTGRATLAHLKPFFAALPSSEASQTHLLKAGDHHLPSTTGRTHKYLLREISFLRFHETLDVLKRRSVIWCDQCWVGAVSPKELKVYKSTRGMAFPIFNTGTKYPHHGVGGKLCSVHKETYSTKV